MTIVIVVAALLVIALLAYLVLYAGLVGARNRVDRTWRGIEALLERRHDLVPSLLATVEGHAAHESAALDALGAARAAAQAGGGPTARGAQESRLVDAIGAILALAEPHPQLGAATAFVQLQEQLTEQEEEIQAARRLYNGRVQSYTARTRSFPSSLIAARGPFPPKEHFPLGTAAARGAPPLSSGA